ncbi:unnamed protein product, partial [Dovyalis caffra]
NDTTSQRVSPQVEDPEMLDRKKNRTHRRERNKGRFNFNQRTPQILHVESIYKNHALEAIIHKKEARIPKHTHQIFDNEVTNVVALSEVQVKDEVINEAINEGII